LTPVKTCLLPLSSSLVPSEVTPGSGGESSVRSEYPESGRGGVDADAGVVAARAATTASPAARPPRPRRSRR